jgi:hypothetical protein
MQTFSLSKNERELLPIFLDYLGFFKNEFAFLVLLGLFIGPFIRPAQDMTVTTIDISHCVEPCQQPTVFIENTCMFLP